MSSPFLPMHRGQVISKLANERNWRNGAEIGVWEGKTLAMVLGECPKLKMIGVDAWEHLPDEMEHYQTFDHKLNEQTARDAVEGFGNRVKLIKATSRRASKLVGDRSLDFVFIDADHRTPAVVEDISIWREKVRPGGVVMGHDINWPSVEIAVRHFYRYQGYNVEPDNVWWVECYGI